VSILPESSKPRPAFKVWLETEEGYVFGPGIYRILVKVEETGTLKGAAESLGMSYRFAWGLVKKAERKLGEPLLKAHKGGRSGGGGAEITDLGKQFLEEYSKIDQGLKELSGNSSLFERHRLINVFDGKVSSIRPMDENIELTISLVKPTNIRVVIDPNSIEGQGVVAGSNVRFEMISSIRKLKHRET
jgi:molybdate transport system regulatory protein